jgi:O-6-methylguanine DNA methyltransferase
VPYCLFETALGTCGIAWSEAGLLALRLPEASREETREALFARAGEGPLEEVPPPAATARPAHDASTPSWVLALVRDVRAHLAGEPRSFADVPLADARVSPFAARVYAALRAVPAGSTTSYGELAKIAGSAGGARAVGGAMAKNPWPIVVPCHRVTGATASGDRGAKEGASLGGFSAYGGVVTKQRLLALEGVVTTPRQGSLFEGAQTLPFESSGDSGTSTRLGRPDVLPASDLGVRKGFARVFRSRRPRKGNDGLPSADEMAARDETWRP